jgi:hypothetical protein
VGEVVALPTMGREFFIDDRGTVLRATWHLDHELVNLSIWRGARCTETFQLPVADAARLIGYLADGLSAAAATAATTTHHAPTRLTDRVRRLVRRAVAR